MSTRRAIIVRVTILVLVCAVGALSMATWLRMRDSNVGHPQAYRLVAGSMNQWTAYGGAWEIADGAIHNNSDERGAKLVAGSSRWTDYALSADLRFDGNHGDMGVIVRSNDEEEGVDAYSGYYAGLRTTDGTLVIGRADYGWMEARPVPMPGGISYSSWYRLKVVTFQCDIAAEAQNLSTMQIAWIVLEEHPCVESGRIGLRSLATGGRWRNISVAPAGAEDYLRIRQHVDAISEPDFPKRESDYNRILPPLPAATLLPQQAATVREQPVEYTHIGDLLDHQRNSGNPVWLRGVVTLTSPELYIQDSTGGIRVKHAVRPILNVGDVVEVHGRVDPDFYSALIESDSIRLLWVGTPVPPIAVTASQAASGAYDARFVEIEGRLSRRETSTQGTQILYITDGAQSFRTVAAYHNDEPQSRLETNSYLRIRGICALSQAYTQGLTPFVVLLRSSEDVQVILDPPWWTPWHESLLFASVLFAVVLIQLFYFRFQRWKSDTIIRERERLAHEIHDTMAQGFAGIGYQIQGIRKSLVHGDRENLPHVSDQLGMAYQLVRRCHEEASRTIAMLSSASPSIQENLLGTLAEVAHRIAENQIRTNVSVEGNPVKLRLRTANSLMHIGREAIANAAAHSAPTELKLTLRFDEDHVELIVKDNGQGFEFTQEKAGFGILGMQKRARDIGGVLSISSTPGSGTEVRIRTRLHSDSLTGRIIKIITDRKKRGTPRPYVQPPHV